MTARVEYTGYYVTYTRFEADAVCDWSEDYAQLEDARDAANGAIEDRDADEATISKWGDSAFHEHYARDTDGLAERDDNEDEHEPENG